VLTGHDGEANKRLALLAYLEKTLVLDYLVMSYVTVKVPQASKPFACMRRSEDDLAVKVSNFCRKQTS
jgi:hypothetical protein